MGCHPGAGQGLALGAFVSPGKAPSSHGVFLVRRIEGSVQSTGPGKPLFPGHLA